MPLDALWPGHSAADLQQPEQPSARAGVCKAHLADTAGGRRAHQKRPSGAQAGVHNWELTIVSPVTRGGIALLGELSKVATVSAARFRSIQEGGDGGLRVTVWASAGEKLEISFVYNVPANRTVKMWRLLIPPGATAGGAATVTSVRRGLWLHPSSTLAGILITRSSMILSPYRLDK